jgi:hypothetical protein
MRFMDQSILNMHFTLLQANRMMRQHIASAGVGISPVINSPVHQKQP